LFEDGTERQMLIDAADQIMTLKGYKRMSVIDVLQETGLSTRAFYRHFDSKADLLEALRLRENASIGRSLARVVASAPNPVAGIEAWLDRYLDLFYEPRLAERTALLSTEETRASTYSESLRHEMRRSTCASLVEALRAGHERGVLVSANPEADAYSIFALVGACHSAGIGEVPDRSVVRAHVIRFAWPALGLASTPSRSRRRVR
jgi:AcrR family transcriptional regulator